MHSTIDQSNGPQNYQQNSSIETIVKFQESNLQQIAHTNTTINRFLSAFIDHVRLTNALTRRFFFYIGKKFHFRVSKIWITLFKRNRYWNTCLILNSTAM